MNFQVMNTCQIQWRWIRSLHRIGVLNTGGNRTMVAAATIVIMAAAASEYISIFPSLCHNETRYV